MATDEFPFRDILHLDKAIYFGFSLNKVVESDILEQVFEIAVEAGYVGGEWGTVVVFLEDFIGGVRSRLMRSMSTRSRMPVLLEDAEDIAVEARLVDAHHVRVSLAKIAGKNKHVSDALQVTEILRSSADSGEVEMIDMTHLVGREGYLLVAIGG